MALSDYSVEELEEALEAKKVLEISTSKPVPLDDIDFTPVIKMCAEFLDDIEETGWADEDFTSYLYEEALEAVFGKGVFNWINKIC